MAHDAIDKDLMQARKIQDDTEKRRDEVFRLQAELKEIRIDKNRYENLRDVLTNRLVLLQGNIERLERRQRQLVDTIPKKAYEETATGEDDS